MGDLSFLVGAMFEGISAVEPQENALESTAAYQYEMTCFRFDIGHLNIHNPYIMRCDSGEMVSPEMLAACVVSDAYFSDNEAVIVFSGRIYLSISLTVGDCSATSYRAENAFVFSKKTA